MPSNHGGTCSPGNVLTLEAGYSQSGASGASKLEHILASARLREFGRLRRRFVSPREKMPPRFALRGVSLAARTLGHEIRVFTQRTTGKDLALLASNRPEIFNKIETTAVKLARGSRQTLQKTLVTFHGISLLASIQCANTSSDTCQTSFERVPNLHEISPGFQLREDDVISNERMQSALRFCKEFSTENGVTEEEDWEKFMREKYVTAWRRKLPESNLYQYRVHGRFNDISAWHFYRTQIDVDYRKQWDRFALKLDVVGTDSRHESDVVHWITKFPYPLKSREYLYVRRSEINQDDNTIALISKAASHPYVEETDEVVRIDKYESEMLIKSHSKLQENGMEFLLTYHDDLKSNIPSYCLDMIVSSGLSEGMHKIYEATQQLGTLAITD